MFSFLNPGLLWALPLAAAPVVLHLLFLRRARRLPFGDLTLLRAAYLKALPATRLRHWLILLLRCLALALLVLAFTRPVFHRRAAAAGDDGLDLVILVDTSWSMGAEENGRKRIDGALAAGAGLLGLLRPADRAAVAAFSDRLEVPLAFSESAAAAREALARLRLSRRGTDYTAALSAAYLFLGEAAAKAERPRRRAVAVLSDNAAHGFARMPASGVEGLPGRDAEVQLIGLASGDAPDNAGVNDLSLVAADDGAALRARLELYGRRSRPGAGLDLFVGDRRVDQRSVDLAPGSPREWTLPLPSDQESRRWGRAQLRRDALPEDDSFFYSLTIQPKPRVLLLYGSPSYMEAGRGGYFLKKLLDGGELPFRLETVDLGRFEQIRIEDYSAVLLADFRSVPGSITAALERFVLRGGGLWVLAETQAQPGSYGDLSRLLPGKIGEAFPQPTPSALKPSAAATALGARWDEFELAQVEIGRSYPLAPNPGAEVWFSDAGGRPLLAAGSFGRGRVLLFASAFDVRWSNLALKPVFTAFMDAGLRRLTGYTGARSWRSLKIGESVVRVWEAGETPPAKIVVRGPDGRRTAVVVKDRRMEFSDTREPGLYVLESGSQDGRAAEVYAVNLDRAGPEGDLTVRADLPWDVLRPDNLREDFNRAVYGSELRTWALALALFLLLLEGFLSRPRFSESAGRAAASVPAGA